MSVGVVQGHTLDANLDRTCDVCIIGSGPGGATLAAGLSERGLDVVVLEEGPAVDRSLFDQTERTAFRDFYQDQGARSTKDMAINILQGRCIGGGSTVNWTTCLRAPALTLRTWSQRFGVSGLGVDDLAPHYDAVEARLGVMPWPADAANANNQVLRRGAAALGIEVTTLPRNVRGCANLGSCGMGCPVDAKQAMHLTYLRDALAHGASVVADARVDRIVHLRRRVTAVHAKCIDPTTRRPTGTRIVIRPKVAVSSAGAINGPALLLRSGLDINGRVGRRTFLHPTVVVFGVFDKPISGHRGAPQVFSSHAFLDAAAGEVGYLLETAPVHPMLASSGPRQFGPAYHDVMANFDRLAAPIALCIDGLLPDDEGGTVRLRWGGHPELEYPWRDATRRAFQAAQATLARLTLAAGAERAITTHTNTIACTTTDDVERVARAASGPHEHYVGSAHQMGGCTMGADPTRHVVDDRFRHHHVDNMFVVDGSVFPTGLGVNPCATICALARLATAHVHDAV